jgi:TRAP-type mannitol/chloroaromatic compound transport system permease small subunit
MKFAQLINALNEKVGFYGAYLILLLVGVSFYEVIARYLFNAPTIWGFEATTFLFGVHFVLAFGYTHKYNGHVAVDVIETRLSNKARLILRIIANLVLFIPAILLLVIGSIIYAGTSWGQWEVNSTSWAPPLYPFKTLMAIGFILLFLQGIAKLIQDIQAFRSLNSAQESPR